MVRFDGEFKSGDSNLDLSHLSEVFHIYFSSITLSNYELIEKNDLKIKTILKNIITKLRDEDFTVEPIYALDRQCKLLLQEYYNI